jgi:hypothetical protein
MMIHLVNSIPYKPNEKVFFIHGDAIRAGIVQAIHVQLFREDNGDLKEKAYWDISEGGNIYHKELGEIRSTMSAIVELAKLKIKSFSEMSSIGLEEDSEVLF